MRLTSLRLHRYGHFEDEQLTLDPAPGRINLLLAPNGAGKSVLRSAFGDLLFGIGQQSPMGFRHGYAGMQIEATGLGPDGAPFAVTRRKGRGQTLLDGRGEPLDPALLGRLLGGADRALLDQLFALDTEKLRSGGRGLLESGGALAEALLAAAGGMRDAQSLRQSLDRARDELAPTRRSPRRPFYEAFDRWSDSRKLLKSELLKPEQWQDREAALAALHRAREAAAGAEAQSAETIHRLERGRRLRPLLARHDAAAGWLTAHPDAPVLAADLGQRLAEARGARIRAEDLLDKAIGRRNSMAAEAAAAGADDALLAQADRIAALREAAGTAERAARELPGWQAELDLQESRIGERLRALGLDLPIDRASEALPPAGLLASLRRLAGAHSTLAEAAAAAPGRLAECRQTLAAAEAAITALPPAGDPEALAALIAEITKDGEPATLAAAAARATTEAATELEHRLARMPAALRDTAALLALAPPEAALLERASSARDAALAEQARSAEAVATLSTAQAETAARRAALQEEGSLPDATALAVARAHRDAGWALVFRRAFGDGAPDAAAEAGFAGARPLALAFAEAMAAADALADRRITEATRVALAAELDRGLSQQRSALATATAGAEAARAAAEAAVLLWAGLVAPLGLDGTAGLAEAQRILAAREAALAALRALASAKAAEQELAARQAAFSIRLAGALQARREAGLRALLDLAEARLRENRRLQAEATRLELQRAAARQALREAEAAQQLAQDRIGQWQTEWSAALAQLGRDGAEHPADTLGLLRPLEELGPLVEKRQELVARIRAACAEVARFREDCATLCAALAPELPAGSDPFAASRQLDARREAEARRATQRDLLRRQLAEATAQQEQAREAADAAASGYRILLAECGAETEEAALPRIALAEERARHAASLAQAEQALVEGEVAPPFDALRQELDATPAEAVEAALAEARAARAQHAAAVEEALKEAVRIEEEMKRLSDDAAIGRAAAEQASAAALLGRTLEDALLMQLAGSLLDGAMARLQQAGDDALLRRIGDRFAALTEQAYTAVAAQEDERGVLRLSARQPGLEDTAVENLSEGNRDQLFLALRLVAIEDHRQGGGALPFLGDDILQSFDDRRAAAAFRLLLEFSSGTQVILLTHHRHLAEVARACLPEGALHLQRFGTTTTGQASGEVAAG
jgi:uncharacterized protein YhaN